MNRQSETSTARTQMIHAALDPSHSVVVEACAGSGKTWLLVSRLIRILLAGCEPGQILAITYTRKAAAEIEARLRDWLRALLAMDDAAVSTWLAERGYLADGEALERARSLYERMLTARPPLTVTTFHGWFARLLAAAPLSSRYAGCSLSEGEAGWQDEAWARLARDCSAAPEGELATDLLWLYAELGAFKTRKLLRALLERRAEWLALCEACGGFDAVLRSLPQAFGIEEANTPEAAYFSPGRVDDLQTYAALLAINTSKDQEFATKLALALDQVRTGASEPGFAAVCSVLLTREGAPRARGASAAQGKRLGEGAQARLLRLHAELAEAAQASRVLRAEQQALAVNLRLLRVGQRLLAALAERKREASAMDFTDLECEIDRLMRSETEGPLLQARLDARYRHILLDEFQDTNPLQWRILEAWLAAYGTASPPTLFVVGDPKQSIYRFRRAEPRLFEAVAQRLHEHSGALRLSNTRTYRNAPHIVELINTLFAGQPAFTGFEPQSAHRSVPLGRIEVLPLIERDEREPVVTHETGSVARDPLGAPPEIVEDLRRQREAVQLAEGIAAMIGQPLLVDRDGCARPVRFGDVMILVRRRTYVDEYEHALRRAGIPYLSVGRGGLLGTLEVRDIIALLRVLADPADDHALAHALRAPIFDLEDDQLLVLARRREGSWWARLEASAPQDAAFARAAGLLAAWRVAAAHLPVHDLLDRVLAEGQAYARYARRVPVGMWPAVRANLEALLALALAVDGGRYPSLPRFLDRVRTLQRRAEEAPDEGLILQDEAGGGRVRVLTIHGAKGLEAPIVWLVDTHVPMRRESAPLLLDWPPEAAAPRHLSFDIGTPLAARRAALQEAELRAAEREDLNLLYVALTRAEQALFVSAVALARGNDVVSAYTRVAEAVATLSGGASRLLGDWPSGLPVAEVGRSPAPVHQLPSARPSLPAVGQRRTRAAANDAGIVFGSALHAWLEAWARGLPLPTVEPRVEAAARTVLGAPALARFFDSSRYRRAYTEVGFRLQDGQEGRIDRLVDFADEVWILDFKSGQQDASRRETYARQLAGYAEAVSRLLPGKPLRAGLITPAGELLELPLPKPSKH